MKKTASTLLFDLGGVILNLDYNLTIEAFKKLGVENFDALYTQANQNNVFDDLETGNLSDGEFRNYMRTFVKQPLKDEEVDAAWNAMLLDLPQERIKLLEALSKKYRLLLYSNTNAIHYRGFREIIDSAYGTPNILENIFHKTYYSHLIGKRKPNAESFQFILNEQGITAEETIFIDDSIQHVEGAKGIGITAVHLQDKDIINLFKGWV